MSAPPTTRRYRSDGVHGRLVTERGSGRSAVREAVKVLSAKGLGAHPQRQA